MGCRVRYCCCGCTLATGCIILGSISLFFAALGLISSIAQLNWPNIAWPLFSTIMNVLLIYGSHYRRSPFILAYLIYYTIQTVLICVGLIVGVILNIVPDVIEDEVLSSVLWIALGSAALLLPLQIYLNIVVYSFFRELKEGENGSLVNDFPNQEAGAFTRVSPAYPNGANQFASYY